MDWALAIERNRDALIEIVTRLFLLAGIRTGVAVGDLPRALRLRILAILRPAEYAARRLIAMAACQMTVTVRPSRRKEPDGTVTIFLGLGFLPSPFAAKPAGSVSERPPAFALFDPFKHYGSPWLKLGEQAKQDRRPSLVFALPPNEPVDARGLCRRIRALEGALQDLERHAARLARWRARSERGFGRPVRASPMRPGYPPGWKRHPRTDAEMVLKECNVLALDAWADTS